MIFHEVVKFLHFTPTFDIKRTKLKTFFFSFGKRVRKKIAIG